jgi:hypothetical protein
MAVVWLLSPRRRAIRFRRSNPAAQKFPARRPTAAIARTVGDVFLNIKDVADNAIPKIGDRVELTVEKLPDGRRKALNVRIV